MGERISCKDIEDNEAEEIRERHNPEITRYLKDKSVQELGEFFINLPKKEGLVVLVEYMLAMQDTIKNVQTNPTFYIFDAETPEQRVSILTLGSEVAEEHQKVWEEKGHKVSKIRELEAEAFMFPEAEK